MSKHPLILAIVLAAAIGVPSLLAHLVATSGTTTPTAPTTRDGDDGWRLTNSGWEQINPRHLTASALPLPPHHGRSQPQWPALSMPDIRWDMHPATLALLLILGATTAFCLFPNETSPARRRGSETLF